ncbi:MAG TPA: bifunctional nuclease family protein [Intrasporangium sp.]|uniref:bifunctional nuclease family protein n=1 Tax=Intrasporangium sp. TaxID=1925024 RepID=UPI002B496BBE|nr:bifunctional nuclease family protein [Intrasporangium sp.]HET6667138.1 bifunctional nuclease family protein [Intrasporangium sp.]HEX5968717.1 bifunctional nuclease family protein [Intrasporangium sp.]HKX68418.1 bifunctional nuclease family protein [Intrasporangium sp.]
MREVDVLGVRVEMPTNQPIVLLRERDGGRYLPIWIGAPEAAAITYAQQGVVPPRPLTHDLMRDILAALGHELTEVRIVALRDSVFHAALVIDGKTEISSRASDAIALALRTGSKVLVEPSILDEAAIVVSSDEDDEVERFKEFLDHVSAEDFEQPGEPGPPKDA